MGLTEIAGAGVVPVPDSETELGLPGALWTIDSEALFDPELVGVKVTLTGQLSPAAILEQLWVTANAPESAPDRVIEVIDSVAIPALLIVTTPAALVTLIG